MPLIVESNGATAEVIASVSGSGTVLLAGLDELRRSLSEHPDEHAVVLGPSVDMDAAASLAENLRVTRPGVSVILMRRRVDTPVLAEALRSGMREVIEERDLSSLGDAIRRSHQVYRAVTGPGSGDGAVGRQVTVFSPKGGVGKTTVAANLTVALAARPGTRVCLVDLDLAFGDIAITLQLFPARTIADAVLVQDAMDFSVLEPLLTPHKLGFSTLVAPVQPDAKDSIPASLIASVLDTLKKNFDFVVVDTSPAFDEHVLQAFDETDELLLVTTLDVPTLKNVKIACETLDLLNFPKQQRHLVLNRADDRVGLAPEKVESTLGMTIEQRIPTSAEVANATNVGEPIVASHPKHPVSQAINHLADIVTGAPGEATPGRGRRAKSEPRRGLLRRQGR
jgi:pilus assembly protein CpaE